MSLVESLKTTEQTLKLDVDAYPFPEWFRLMRLFNFLFLFPKGRIERSPAKNAYHLFADGIPSTLHLRMTLRDCAGRIYMSSKRLQTLGACGDIIYSSKGTFQIIRNNSKLIVCWTRKPSMHKYEPCDLHDVLRLPFKLSELDCHRKRRIRWFKRWQGMLKEKMKRRGKSG